MVEKPLRIGAVNYLNTKPLIYQLERLAPEARLVLDLPSRLADSLRAGQVDIALIPSIEWQPELGYTIVSDACIACRGPVLSVKLFSRVPIPEIRSLALDEGSRTSIALAGELAPGPDYKLYLSPEFVETEADFKQLKPGMVRVADVKTFKNFLVPLPEGVDPARYTTVIVWCETFSQFITAAKYR